MLYFATHIYNNKDFLTLKVHYTSLKICRDSNCYVYYRIGYYGV